MNRQHSQLVERIESSGKELLEMLKAFTDEEMMRSPGEGEWSIHAVLAHVRDVEEQVMLRRAERILKEKEPPQVEDFDQDAWNREHYAAKEPLKEILADWRKARKKFLALLSKTPDKEWIHYAIHPYYGKISLEWLAVHDYLHTLEHLHQMLEMRERNILKALNG